MEVVPLVANWRGEKDANDEVGENRTKLFIGDGSVLIINRQCVSDGRCPPRAIQADEQMVTLVKVCMIGFKGVVFEEWVQRQID